MIAFAFDRDFVAFLWRCRCVVAFWVAAGAAFVYLDPVARTLDTGGAHVGAGLLRAAPFVLAGVASVAVARRAARRLAASPPR